MLVLNLSLGSELVPKHPAKIPSEHVILEFWKTDKVFIFAANYMLGVYAYVYAQIKIQFKKFIRRATKILQRRERKKSWKSKRPQKRAHYFEINGISTVLN